MEKQIIAIYCLLDDYILSIGYEDWPNVKLTTAEVIDKRCWYEVFLWQYRYS